MAENREETLMKNFVSALNDVFGIKITKEEYEKISAEKFVSLKKALSNINNIVTLKVTNLFIDKLLEVDFINKVQEGAMKNIINSTSANANGHDVEYPDPKVASVDNAKKILAEVKCNIPYNKKSFGSDQRDRIIEDINGLLKAKSKRNVNTSDYYKFMVFMDYKKDGCNVKKSVENLLKEYNNVKWYLDEYDKGKEDYGLTKDNVYIILI